MKSYDKMIIISGKIVTNLEAKKCWIDETKTIQRRYKLYESFSWWFYFIFCFLFYFAFQPW